MIITRIQVEEGFLNGLDLRLSTGLNVLIGARGTGKTSIVELIRFGLGAQANTADSARKATDHARSILGSGQVTLTLEGDGTTATVVRAADDNDPRSDAGFSRPVVFAQSEIEQVGLLPQGRLSIIDGFVSDRSAFLTRETKLSVDARSATAELAAAQRELADLQERLAELPAVDTALQELAAQEATFSATSAAAAEKKSSLDLLTQQLSVEAVRDGFLERAIEAAEYWTTPLAELLILSPAVEAWSAQDADPIADLRARFANAEAQISRATDEFEAIRAELKARRDQVTERRVPIEAQARTIRREIDALQEGAGQVARRAAQLRERKAQLEALRNVTQERRTRMVALQERRGAILNQLESLRQQRFAQRQAVASKLNRQLAPRIKIVMTRAGDVSAYHQVLVEALRGSGLRYSELATQISRSMSPRELLEAVELNNFEEVASTCGVTKDRAARLVAHLRESSLEELATCNLEDEAEFSLLDGGDYKDLSEISTGQRCTIVLPILLEHKQRILVLDQPEDHIDNAFITDTIIKALEARSDEGQIIVSTHNANIPVLGDADLVVQMASDGRLGFVKHAGELEAAPTIEAITGLMEGGREAFRRRATVYARY
ncbi:AAA family ATPase [Phenylobacterium koreense]|uniref:Energy-coupling factor transporter ATP-binding protein EcfA2 n=1 Tax=Phenylobacterium koreense TaxID=266125 RepID=A0ABV2EEL7_9CAUL